MGADPLIASQRGGEHALADPALTGQAQRGGVTGEPDRAAAHSQQRLAVPSQLGRAIHIARRQRRHPIQPSRHPRPDQPRGHPTRPAVPDGDLCRRRGSRWFGHFRFEQLKQPLTDSPDTAVPLAGGKRAGVQRTILARIMRPLHLAHLGELRHVLPPTRRDQHRHPPNTGLGQCRQLLGHDEVGVQEVGADQQQRDAGPGDRLGQPTAPDLTGRDAVVCQQSKPADHRLQHHLKPAQPLPILPGVADEDTVTDPTGRRRGGAGHARPPPDRLPATGIVCPLAPTPPPASRRPEPAPASRQGRDTRASRTIPPVVTGPPPYRHPLRRHANRDGP